jgi:hypothetical protein
VKSNQQSNDFLQFQNMVSDTTYHFASQFYFPPTLLHIQHYSTVRYGKYQHQFKQKKGKRIPIPAVSKQQRASLFVPLKSLLRVKF